MAENHCLIFLQGYHYFCFEKTNPDDIKRSDTIFKIAATEKIQGNAPGICGGRSQNG